MDNKINEPKIDNAPKVETPKPAKPKLSNTSKLSFKPESSEDLRTQIDFGDYDDKVDIFQSDAEFKKEWQDSKAANRFKYRPEKVLNQMGLNENDLDENDKSELSQKSTLSPSQDKNKVPQNDVEMYEIANDYWHRIKKLKEKTYASDYDKEEYKVLVRDLMNEIQNDKNRLGRMEQDSLLVDLDKELRRINK